MITIINFSQSKINYLPTPTRTRSQRIQLQWNSSMLEIPNAGNPSKPEFFYIIFYFIFYMEKLSNGSQTLSRELENSRMLEKVDGPVGFQHWGVSLYSISFMKIRKIKNINKLGHFCAWFSNPAIHEKHMHTHIKLKDWRFDQILKFAFSFLLHICWYKSVTILKIDGNFFPKSACQIVKVKV